MPSTELYNKSMSGITKISRKNQIEQIEQAFISQAIFKEHIKDVPKFYNDLEKATFFTIKSFMMKVLKKKNFSYKTYSSMKEEFIEVANKYKNSLLDVKINSTCSSIQQGDERVEHEEYLPMEEINDAQLAILKISVLLISGQ